MSRTLMERFIEKFEIEPNGCWQWTAAKHSAGYGSFGDEDGKTRLAHRISYRLFVGEIPEGLTLDHLCRNRLCVNPTHLEPVPFRENVLRGIAPPAENARKTHCPRGHAYNRTNTRVNRDGSRHCRTCFRERARAA